MGHCLSSPINYWLVQHLMSLQEDGHEGHTLDEFEREFTLNKLPGSDHAPKCHMYIKNSSIQCQDLCCVGQPLGLKTSKITIEIGEAVVRCDDLGYILRITGRITIFDVLVTLSFTPSFENGITVSDIDSEATVKKVKSEIELHVNGTDHSRLANVLLSIDNPEVASNLLNAVFMVQKEKIKDYLNDNIRDIASQCGI